MNLIKPPKKRWLIQSWRSYYRWFMRKQMSYFISYEANNNHGSGTFYVYQGINEEGMHVFERVIE